MHTNASITSNQQQTHRPFPFTMDKNIYLMKLTFCRCCWILNVNAINFLNKMTIPHRYRTWLEQTVIITNRLLSLWVYKESPAIHIFSIHGMILSCFYVIWKGLTRIFPKNKNNYHPVVLKMATNHFAIRAMCNCWCNLITSCF